MTAEKSLILDADQVKQKIKRMAFEIYEHNFKEKNIVIAGIDGQGYVLAKLLAKQVESISPIEVKLVKINLDKLAPQESDITLDCDLKEVKKIDTAVLINRGHTLFPIYSLYTGYELSTTIKDHVEVKLSKDEMAVYLH